MKQIFGFLALVLLIAGCSSKKSHKGHSDGEVAPDYVKWESVSTENNPKIETEALKFGSIDRINLDLFGFAQDVRVEYSPRLTPGTAELKVYSVWRKSARSGSLDVSESKVARKLNVRYTGTYECSIKIHNGEISELEGLCFVRVVLTLPAGAEIEVYNVESLISKRFFPMSNQELNDRIDHAFPDDKRMNEIDTYLASYKETGKTPSLLTSELGKVIKEFSLGDQKLSVLSKLQSYVSDRQNLGTMIDDSFSFFDREKARQIVGL